MHQFGSFSPYEREVIVKVRVIIISVDINLTDGLPFCSFFG